MPKPTRKKPFSGKAKKQQLQTKKQRQISAFVSGSHSGYNEDDINYSSDLEYNPIQKINKQPKSNSLRNRYTLQFFKDSKEEILKRKEQSRSAIVPLSLKDQEVSNNYFPPEIDMPKRPKWDFSMSKACLEFAENKYYTEYLENMEKLSTSYFELNLETWRQLWRVLEMSDILLIIVDIRYAVLMFPPYLYEYITNELQKDMILVLNKVDLAPPALVIAWKEYFHTVYPKLHILMFTSYPTYNLCGNKSDTDGIKQRRRKGKLKMAAEGAQKLLDICKEIVGDDVDLTSWQEKIQEEMQMEFDLDDADHKSNITIEKGDTSYIKHERYKNGVLSIGCIGTPNVGKSSLMNALMGKKVVSVSRTPGHTKHFQTIFLTKTVCLCDCPGLVFPSTVPKQLQILMGCFPIAQVSEPYTTIKFLAERIDLPKILKLQHPDNDDTWSAMDICDGWASKRSFFTARAARHDTYRAANSLLRMALEGKICIYVYPPDWSLNKEKFENHPEIELVKWIQAKNKGEDVSDMGVIYISSDDENDEQKLLENREHEEKISQETSDNSDDSNETTSEDSEIPHVVNKFETLSTDISEINP